MNNIEETATKLRRIREIFGYSQEYVAERMGISQPAYWQKENGKRVPSDVRFQQIAELYSLSMEDLKFGELNTVLIKVHEIQIEILKKKMG
ncbi:DNA-binding XRE family transcriptional regulator [Arcicella aurantiaca]|uniref:DNA-binding XRE family transcriptional regulator n=1 Tax=Arcicella aurantiaca TaxID=591202 RepID=A0A316DHC6_9BACT|nr:helix-turn-helix transcriptional regulator [Arcicella aurantiaca]PWK16639.1 DNA-binding XRE family transcriptional regulator [Arcicella aurantiaca]